MRYLKITLCLTALTAVSAALFAEQETHPMPSSHMQDDPGLKGELGLTPDQQAKWKSAREAQTAAMKPLMETHQGLMKKLEGQVQGKAADAEIQTTLAELKASRMAMRNLSEQFENQKEGLLSPTQRAKLMLKFRGPEGREKMQKRMKRHKETTPQN